MWIKCHQGLKLFLRGGRMEKFSTCHHFPPNEPHTCVNRASWGKEPGKAPVHFCSLWTGLVIILNTVSDLCCSYLEGSCLHSQLGWPFKRQSLKSWMIRKNNLFAPSVMFKYITCFDKNLLLSKNSCYWMLTFHITK